MRQLGNGASDLITFFFFSFRTLYFLIKTSNLTHIHIDWLREHHVAKFTAERIERGACYQPCCKELQLSMITPWLIDNWLPTHKKCSELRLITFFLLSIPLIASGKIPLKPHRASNYLLIIYRAFCFHCGHVAPRKTWNLFQEFSSLSSEPFCYFSSFLAALRNSSFLVNLFVFNWSEGASVSLKHHMSYSHEDRENENKLFAR